MFILIELMKYIFVKHPINKKGDWKKYHLYFVNFLQAHSPCTWHIFLIFYLAGENCLWWGNQQQFLFIKEGMLKILVITTPFQFYSQQLNYLNVSSAVKMNIFQFTNILLPLEQFCFHYLSLPIMCIKNENPYKVISNQSSRVRNYLLICFSSLTRETMYILRVKIHSAAAAAAAKSLQSCLTLCDPTDGSPQGSSVPGILQARTLEWVAISFSNA